MLKFGIFMSGVVIGMTISAILLKKGRENMEQTMVLERTKTLDEQLIEAIQRKNPKFVELQVDEKGNVVIDKEEHPNLYDWVENG